jgi:hypothetical protein
MRISFLWQGLRARAFVDFRMPCVRKRTKNSLGNYAISIPRAATLETTQFGVKLNKNEKKMIKVCLQVDGRGKFLDLKIVCWRHLHEDIRRRRRRSTPTISFHRVTFSISSQSEQEKIQFITKKFMHAHTFLRPSSSFISPQQWHKTKISFSYIHHKHNTHRRQTTPRKRLESHPHCRLIIILNCQFKC